MTSKREKHYNICLGNGTMMSVPVLAEATIDGLDCFLHRDPIRRRTFVVTEYSTGAAIAWSRLKREAFPRAEKQLAKARADIKDRAEWLEATIAEYGRANPERTQ